jgi:DHA3 family macrolide efflux protein-like MFS transporter
MANALRSGNSRLLVGGQLISQVCDKLMAIGAIWIVADRFGGRWIPAFVALGSLPHLLFFPFAGALVSRWGALKTVIRMDLFRGFIALAAFVAARSVAEPALIGVLCAATFFSALGSALFNPAILSLPVSIEPAEGVPSLTALVDVCFSLGNVLGPVLSVVAYARGGIAGLFLVNGLSYFFAAALSIRIRPAGAVPSVENVETGAPAKVRLREILRRYPTATGMLGCFAFMNLFFAPIQIFIPWYAKHIYADGIGGVAKLELAIGLGSVAGGLFVAWKKLPGSFFLRTFVSLFVLCLSFLGFLRSSTILEGVASLFALGFSLGLVNVVLLGFFQLHPKTEHVPFLMSLVNLISVAMVPVSMALVGGWLDDSRMESLSTVCGWAVLALLPLLFLVPGIRTVKDG